MTLNDTLAMIYEYFNQQYTANIAAAWRVGLKANSIDDKDASMALVSIYSRLKFVPKIVDVIEYLHGSEDDKAQRAFIVVWDALSKHGTYNPIVFDDLRIHATLGRLGFQELGQTNLEQKNTARAQFIRAYKSARVTSATPRMLLGRLSGAVSIVGDRAICLEHIRENRRISEQKNKIKHQIGLKSEI